MDKKNTIIGIIFLVASFGLIFWQGKEAQKYREENPVQPAPEEVTSSEDLTNVADSGAEGSDSGAATPFSTPAASDTPTAIAEDAPSLFAEPQVDVADTVLKSVPVEASESTYVLENAYIRVTFTSLGGAIKKVEFVHRNEDGVLDYPTVLEGNEPYSFNVDPELPALALAIAQGDEIPEQFAPNYKMIGQTDSTITFTYDSPDGGQIIRGYKVEPTANEDKPYLIQHQTRFVNKSDKVLPLKKLYVNLGAVPPTEGDIYGDNQNFGYLTEGDLEFIGASKLTGSSGGFLGMGSSQPIWKLQGDAASIQWASVKNQFFTGVITPHESQLGNGYFIDVVKLESVNERGEADYALRGSIRFDLGLLPKGEEKILDLEYYVGPKEYNRLKNLGKKQDEVMQLAPDFFFIRHFAAISKLLLNLMLWLSSFIPNWGWTIIVMTIIIKAAMWPLTAVQVRSAKQMSKIQKPLQEMREKYKDNPQVMQKKTMELFKEHKVNPAAGCLPLFIQLPIFLSLFYTLRTASELRFASFFWVDDLSVADTVSWLPDLPQWIPFFGGPIHILPLLMTITMVFQMRMTPTPTTDNLQRKMFQFMPFIFLFFCYAFPAGLVLYWTCQNLLTILQQWLTNRSKDDPAEVTVIPAEKPKKNSFAKKKSSKKKR